MKFFGRSNDAELSPLEKKISQLLEKTALLEEETLADLEASDLLKDLPRHLKAVQARVEDIAELSKNKELEQTAKKIHSLIGTASMVGAGALSVYAEKLDLELAGLQGWPKDELWLSTIERLYNLTEQELNKRIPNV